MITELDPLLPIDHNLSRTYDPKIPDEFPICGLVAHQDHRHILYSIDKSNLNRNYTFLLGLLHYNK